MTGISSEIRKQVETALAFHRKPLEFLQKNAENNLHFSRFKIGSKKFVHVFDPELIKHILHSGHKNYSRTYELETLKLALGNGLPTNEGESWLKQRKTILPLLHKKYLESFANYMVECTAEVLEKWNSKTDGVVKDVYSEMTELTLAIITQTLFGSKLKENRFVIKNLVAALTESVSIIMQDISKTSVTTNPHRQSIEENAKKLRFIISEQVDSQKITNQPLSLLNMLLQSKDADTGESMSSAQLNDELISLLFTGHETSSVALTFALQLIYSHPEVYKRFTNELKLLDGKAPGPEDMKKLSYTLCIIHETLRLYPPVWNIIRLASKADITNKLSIEAGDTIFLSPYVMHRSEKFWNEPEKFNPDRFSDMKSINEFIYFPFGAGPRKCIGYQFALMSITIVLAMIGQKFILHPLQNKIELNPLITIRPGKPMSMKLTKC